MTSLNTQDFEGLEGRFLRNELKASGGARLLHSGFVCFAFSLEFGDKGRSPAVR